MSTRIIRAAARVLGALAPTRDNSCYERPSVGKVKKVNVTPDYATLVWGKPGATRDELEALALSLDETLSEHAADVGAAVSANFRPPYLEVLVSADTLPELLDMVTAVATVGAERPVQSAGGDPIDWDGLIDSIEGWKV